MRRQFARAYDLPEDRQLTLDNIALLGDVDPGDARTPTRLTVLHLSNLSAAKGAGVFLDLATELSEEIDDVYFEIAGPRSADAEPRLARAVARGARIRHLGEVAGAIKRSALQRADVIVLPSTYRHEAQPLVLYEAAQHAAIPLAWSVGWIPAQMERLRCRDMVAPPGDREALLAKLRELASLSAEQRTHRAASVATAYRQAQRTARHDLEHFIALLRDSTRSRP